MGTAGHAVAGSGVLARRGRALLAVGLLAGAATLLAQPAGALGKSAPSPIQVSVADGYDGSVPAGAWVPVDVTVVNSGPDFHGTVVVNVADSTANGQSCFTPSPGVTQCSSGGSFGSAPGRPVVYRVPVQIAAGTTKYLVVDVVADGSSPVRATLVDSSGGSVASGTASIGTVSGSQPTSVAVLSDLDSTLDAFGEVSLPGGNQVQVVHLTPATLPDSAALLQGFAVVAVDDASTQEMTAVQRTSLVDYVEGGGTLVVCGGVEGSSTAAGLPGELVPARVSGSGDVTLARLAGFLGVAPFATTAEVSALSPRQGVITLAEASTPLLVEGNRGSGRAVVVAFDPSAPPFAGWSGTAVLLRRLVSLASAGPASGFGGGNASTVAFGGGPVPIMPGMMGPVAGLARTTDAVGGTVVDIPSFSLPSSGLLVALLVGYILLVGPVNFWVLARLRRRELAWITVPVMSAAVAFLAYGSGLGTNRTPSVTEVRVITFHPGSARAEVDSWAALYLPHGGTHQLTLPAGSLVTGLGMGENPPVVEAADVPRVALSGGSSAVSAYAATRDANARGTVSARLVARGGTLSGTLVNHLGVGLSDAVVVDASGAMQTLGSLAAGATAEVKVTASSSAVNNGGMVLGLPPGMPGFFMSSGISTSAQRAALRRQQVLPALEELAVQEASAGPVLVALADSPVLAPDVQGSGVGLTDLDAVVVPLAAPASVGGAQITVLGQLLDGGSGPSGLGGAVSLGARGTALFRFELPGSGWTHLAVAIPSPPANGVGGVSVSYGGGSPVPVTAVPAPTGPTSASSSPYTIEVFNPTTGGWDAAGTASAFPSTFVLPNPAVHTGIGGIVMLRVQAGGTGLSMGMTPTLAASAGGAA